jgi:8-oxo-dGTP pyrophosphatase MutT (NUDIX family)
VRVDRSSERREPARPASGEELNTGEVVEARPAATLILLRDAAHGPEVLLVKRNPEQRFMGGAWVFPGGAVKEGDGGAAGTALRELEEEAGIAMSDPAVLVPFSRWVTPEEVTIRFDTAFFVAAAPSGAEARPDGSECVDARWLRPREALEAGARDELLLVFPTIKTLEQLTGFDSVAQALAAARERDVAPVQPRVVVKEGGAEILLPGEHGHES